MHLINNTFLLGLATYLIDCCCKLNSKVILVRSLCFITRSYSKIGMACNQGNSNLPNNPTIHKLKFSKESDGEPEKYCQRIIDQHNDGKDAKYEKTSDDKTSNSRVITYTKSNDEINLLLH